MFPLADGETVVRLRRRLVRDPYSNEETLADWSDPDELEVEGVALGPSSTVEPSALGREQVVSQMSVYCGPDEDILPEDRIRARSGVWDVVGEVPPFVNPFTAWSPGAELAIRKVRG